MRFSRVILAGAILGAVACVLVPGCRDATQVTLDISLRNAACSEIHGTAVTVGIDAQDTEARVAAEYVTGATSSCNVAPTSQNGVDMHGIGTLVVTPSDAGHASVIVVVAYDQIAPSSCAPPLYKGCIVARRQFSFTDHTQVVLPITIDPNCKDVPCDAFSTCRTGKCFAAATECSAGTCVEPGDPGDGGTSEAGQITPDTGVPDDGSAADGASEGGGDAGQDGGTDASDAGSDGAPGTTGPATCDAITNLLVCNASACDGTNGRACCGANTSATVCRVADSCIAGDVRFCCMPTDCPSGTCLMNQVAKGGSPQPPGVGVGICGK